MIWAACSEALGIGRIDWLLPSGPPSAWETRMTHYLSKYFSAAFAYTSGSCSRGALVPPFLSLFAAGGFLSGVAPRNSTRAISTLPVSTSGIMGCCGWTSVKRPSSDGSMSRMRSPKGVSRIARANGPGIGTSGGVAEARIDRASADIRSTWSTRLAIVFVSSKTERDQRDGSRIGSVASRVHTGQTRYSLP